MKYTLLVFICQWEFSEKRGQGSNEPHPVLLLCFEDGVSLMNTKKLLALALGGVLFVGCLAGCNTAAASQGGDTSTTGTTSPQITSASGPSLSATAEDGWADNDVSYEEQFKPYE